MQSLGAAIETFGVQLLIHHGRMRTRAQFEGLSPFLREGFGFLAPAFEARPVAGGQRGA